MPERHRPGSGSGEAAEPDVGQIAAADTAGVNIDERIAWTAVRQADLVE